MLEKFYKNFALLAAILAFCVVILGAYVRLSNAGLGCPDWPGCYGKLIVPDSTHAEKIYPGSPLESHKAWKEMIHRYLAASLGFFILVLMIFSGKWKKRQPDYPLFIPFVLFGIVLFQALLGRWTVTIKLHPLVVMAHLLGGFTTLGVLWWNYLSIKKPVSTLQTPYPYLYLWILFGFMLLLTQISLGGWTSANYASLACPDFPTCQGQWVPRVNFQEAFHLLKGFGPNYEGGVLNNEARMTIHFMHRVGAFVTFLYLSFLSFKIYKAGSRKNALILTLFLVLQVLLGISNVLFHLPLLIAVAHNGVAALLFLTLIFFNYSSKPRYPFWLIVCLIELAGIAFCLLQLHSSSGFSIPL